MSHLFCSRTGGTWMGGLDGWCDYDDGTTTPQDPDTPYSPGQRCANRGGIWIPPVFGGTCFTVHLSCASWGGAWTPAGSVNGTCVYPDDYVLTPKPPTSTPPPEGATPNLETQRPTASG